jgi:cytochrome c oxidase subunit 2
MLGAGTLPNTRDHLRQWVTNSQVVKPGNRMPPVTLDDASVDALLTYLRSLR